MRHTTMNITRHVVYGIVGCAALTFAAPALAAPILPFELQLAPGTGGEPLEYQNGAIQPNKNSGPGNEQPVSTWVMKDGKVYVVTLYMSSNVEDRNNDNNAWQCKCGVVEIGANGNPTQVVNEKLLTTRQRNGANRPCNHPAVTTDGEYILWAFGSDSNNNNNQVDTYAGILDTQCNEVQAPILIENRAGNNGAPAISSPHSPGAASYVMAAYLENGQRTRLVSLAKDMTAQGPALRVVDEVNIVEPANIGRPTLARVTDELYVACAAKGANRPPEDGVACAAARIEEDGNITVTYNDVNGNNRGHIIAASVDCDNVNNVNPARRCMNQPVATHLGGGRVAVQVLGSDGTGRATNGQSRGTTHAYIYTLQVDTTAGTYNTVGSRKDVTGGFQSHSGICAAAYGADPGQLHLMYVDAPITGSGLGVVVPFFLERLTNTWTQMVADQRAMGSENADSGYLQAILGQNPNRNNGGRDFMTCLGGVPNPGANVVDGFRPNVDTFIVTPYVGRREGDPDEPKNGLYLTMHPGRLNAYVAPGVSTSSSAASSSSSAAAASSSGSSSGGGGSCPTGTENCGCFPNNTCYPGFACENTVCKADAGGAASSSSAAASSSSAAASSSSSAAASSGGGSSSGGAASQTGGDASGGNEDSQGGCTCALPGTRGGAAGMLLLALGVMVARRRRA